jgi:hypothetical protein
LHGPADARRAVLASLAARSPWPLARRAVHRGREIGAAPGAALRLGCLAEALGAGLETCALAHGGAPLPARLQRARRVLVADTLLTLCWEIASELPERAFPAVAAGLKEVVGDGFLARVAAARPPPPDPAASAAAFLDRTLPLLARAARGAA